MNGKTKRKHLKKASLLRFCGYRKEKRAHLYKWARTELEAVDTIAEYRKVCTVAHHDLNLRRRR